MSSRHVVKYGRSMELKLFYAEGKNDEICPHGRFRIALASFVDIYIKLIIPLIDLGRSHVSYVLYGRSQVALMGCKTLPKQTKPHPWSLCAVQYPDSDARSEPIEWQSLDCIHAFFLGGFGLPL